MISLEEVKRSASFATVLAHYGIALPDGGRERSVHCPFHDDQTPSLRVNVECNIFYCFGCEAGGSVLDFVARLEGVDLHEAAERVAALSGLPEAMEGDEKAPARAQAPARSSRGQGWGEEASTRQRMGTPNPPLGFELTLDHNHPYLTERGLAPSTVQRFGLGYCERGLLAGRIAIPVHNSAGDLVAYVGRWIGDDAGIPQRQGKYRFPRGFRKSLELFNLHRVAPSERSAILVEGFFSVFAFHQMGYWNAVALMGRSVSRAQQELLVSRFERVALLLDGDEPGREGARRASQALGKRLRVSVLKCPDGRQPDELRRETLDVLLRRFLS